VRALSRELLSLVVPPLCAACREPEFSGRSLCDSCRRRLVALAGPRCRCGAPAHAALAACEECRGRRLAYERAWAPFAYDGVCRDLVRALKRRGAVPVARLMAAEIAVRAPDDWAWGTFVPVPAHPSRRRLHGFNQAAMISAALARRTGLPAVEALSRSGGALPQVGLEHGRRLANARASVRLAVPARVPRRAVLVDDVYTTGATLDACAQVLKAGGARHVSALTFARAVRRSGKRYR